ncbi:MAG: hypothetical protein QM775_02300 [Pirellulales bacterium]
MPIQSTAQSTTGLPTPNNTMPRAESGSVIDRAGAYATGLPSGGVASTLNTATRNSSALATRAEAKPGNTANSSHTHHFTGAPRRKRASGCREAPGEFAPAERVLFVSAAGRLTPAARLGRAEIDVSANSLAQTYVAGYGRTAPINSS